MAAEQPRCVASALEPFRAPANNTLHGVKWAPDGSCLLTASEDRQLRVFELPEELLSTEPPSSGDGGDSSAVVDAQPELPCPLQVAEGAKHGVLIPVTKAFAGQVTQVETNNDAAGLMLQL